MPPTDPNFGIRLRTSNLGLRTSALTPGTWHRIPNTFIFPFLCFHTHLRSHLHFCGEGERRHETEYIR